MNLGYLGRVDWRDMSDYLVHLTTDYDRLRNIVESSFLIPAPLGAVAKHPSLEKLPSQASCCLSEIPLDRLERLVDRHGSYGIGFTRAFVISQNGARVWYLEEGVEVTSALFESRRTQWYTEPKLDDLVWRLTPFIDYVLPDHHFEWEREWRVLDGLNFTAAQIVFVFAPEADHSRVRDELAAEVPLVDPRWPMERIQKAIDGLPHT
jgi:Putative abortive phage resistance protein AbiGi, antitoxin